MANSKNWPLSTFGRQLAQGSGIGDLMDDLGHALAQGGDNLLMLGGGQPAHLPEVDLVWRQRCEQIVRQASDLRAVVGNYEPPLGSTVFRESIARLLRSRYGWDLTLENVAITAGGQTAFFYLFNTQ